MYHCQVNGQTFGPYSAQQLRTLAEEGRLGPEDLICKEGEDRWRKANQFKGLIQPPQSVAQVPPQQHQVSQPQQAQPVAQPQYAQPQYAQPQYAQPQYAQPQYIQPQYAQPQYAQPQQSVVVQNVNQTTIVNRGPEKSVFVALLLAFFFGPIGMLYSTVGGALTMFLVNLILIIPTLGFILLITWPIGCIWAAAAVSK